MIQEMVRDHGNEILREAARNHCYTMLYCKAIGKHRFVPEWAPGASQKVPRGRRFATRDLRCSRKPCPHYVDCSLQYICVTDCTVSQLSLF